MKAQLSDVDALLDGDTAWLLATYQGADGAACSTEAVTLAHVARALGSLAKVSSWLHRLTSSAPAVDQAEAVCQASCLPQGQG